MSNEDAEAVGATHGLLSGTPYLVPDDVASIKKFERVLARSFGLAERAREVGAATQAEATDVFASFGLALRSETVAESNRMEDFEWSAEQVREVVVAHRELMDAPVHSFLQSVRADERTYEALGLYRAQLLGEEWVRAGERPREFEIRQLHALIMAGHHHAGRYKIGPNTIGGARHVPPSPADAAESMTDLADWWAVGSGDPLLDATVVHAWLAHLHPFDDGNGRMARLLANLALSQDSYPPLIVSSSADRGEYYAALDASDDGDILPLFELFGRVLRRSTKQMGSPGYVERVISDRLLTMPSRRRELWHSQIEAFTEFVNSALADVGWSATLQGYPDDTSFEELAELNSDGNSWHLKIFNQFDQSEWLMWFGYNSDEYRSLYGGPSGYPSIFLSMRDHSPGAQHPYTPVWLTSMRDTWVEVVLVPGLARPARIRQKGTWDEKTLEACASLVAKDLVY